MAVKKVSSKKNKPSLATKKKTAKGAAPERKPKKSSPVKTKKEAIVGAIHLGASVIAIAGAVAKIPFTNWGEAILRIGTLVAQDLNFFSVKGKALGVDGIELAGMIAAVPSRMLLIQTVASSFSVRIKGRRVAIDDKLIEDLAKAIVYAKSNDYFEGEAKSAFERLALDLNLALVDRLPMKKRRL